MKVTVHRSIEAEQWKCGGPLPAGVHLCQPEVHWSAGRELVYFTYAKLRPEFWMGVPKMPIPENKTGGGIFDEGWCEFTPAKAGQEGDPYARKALSFTFWKVKSEASVTQDHGAVYLDAKDEVLMGLWHDYCSMSQWPNPIPRSAEYREIDGAYGRGFRPIYLNDGDWLLRERVPKGHDNLGAKDQVTVVTDAEFQALRAA